MEDLRESVMDVNLENLPMEEVFERLKCTKNGLTSEEVQERIAVFGYNKLEEKKENKILKFLGFMWNPLSWVMEAAAIMAIALAHGGNKGPDYPDFIGIIVLLLINSTISFIEENNASNAAAALMARLAPKAKVLRNGNWIEEDAAMLVPGDIISIKLGDIIPADARLLHGDPLKIDQAALTGESLPVTKQPGNAVYSGSTCKQGEIEAVVIATGVNTFFGKAAHLVETTTHVGHFQKVFAKDVDKDMVVLMAARASRLENQDAIDGAIVAMLSDPKQILELAHNKSDIEKKVHDVIDRYADRGLRSLAVARQEVPQGDIKRNGGPWEFVALLPLFDPPRHDSAETIRRALDLGVSVKMITGDQLAIAKETGRRLGMGTNMYPSSSLLGENRGEGSSDLPHVHELIENADGFAGVFPEHKYEIVRRLQARKHICGMTGDGVNDAPALKKADIGIAVDDATDAARSASDIVLTEPGLSVIISAVLTSRSIFQRMKNYTIYAVSITIRIVMGFMLLAVIWKFDFPPLMVLVIAILNDGTIMTISKDRVKPSPMPDHWNLNEIFATGIFIGGYLAITTVVFFWAAYDTSFFPRHFNVKDFNRHTHNMADPEVAKDLREKMSSAVYLQVSTISQALIFVTRARGWSFTERPGLLLVIAFLIAQLIATVISATVSWDLAGIREIGWGWTGVIWLYNILTYIFLDPIKFFVRYLLSGRAWQLLFNERTALSGKNNFGKEEREVAWAAERRTQHGRRKNAAAGAATEMKNLWSERNSFRDLNLMAEEAKRRAEIVSSISLVVPRFFRS
ncbi:hypothetical protein Cgig2_013050 [Carnegiea gigantea]|uniref:Cation-transporting P-type ATPase N-terminal domain-containing protein n=1 Tax=Carnegiea gigantea TaxID=171969 RepID=A0A9Q1KQY0_9CARY|nr:hypothetical protein Cgig2_013050 [Carnegiea gigantea]